MKYRLFASPREDISSGWVWVAKPKFPPRTLVQILNKKTRRKICCEALHIEQNFLEGYNQHPRIPIEDPENALVINAWYRKLLGDLSTQTEEDLEIISKESRWGHFRASLQHPQLHIRLATWLGIIGLILGTISVILGIISICIAILGLRPQTTLGIRRRCNGTPNVSVLEDGERKGLGGRSGIFKGTKF